MLCTTRDTAKALHVSKKTIYRMMSDGRIPQQYIAKMGKEWRFNVEAIEQHLLGQHAELPKNP